MTLFTQIKIKELLADSKDIQAGLKKEAEVPTTVIIKSVRNPFTNKETNDTTQRVHAVSGTSLLDMVELDFTLVNQSIDATEAINKTFQIVDYSFALEANMSNGDFLGYSATGLKLLVTKLVPLKSEGK